MPTGARGAELAAAPRRACGQHVPLTAGLGRFGCLNSTISPSSRTVRWLNGTRKRDQISFRIQSRSIRSALAWQLPSVNGRTAPASTFSRSWPGAQQHERPQPIIGSPSQDASRKSLVLNAPSPTDPSHNLGRWKRALRQVERSSCMRPFGFAEEARRPCHALARSGTP